MKYENAKDILPEELFEKVRKYASGKLLYVPIVGERCQWGAKNGNRLKNEKRNQEIRQLYKNGLSLEQLSARFFLTPESIKNILYSKKGTKMNLDEILKLYDDAPPLAVEKMYQVDERKTWGEYYYIADYLVTFPKRKLTLHIHCYPYTTPARIEEQNKTTAAYQEAGCSVCRIVPNQAGALSCCVSFDGHDCVVFAEEYREKAIPIFDEAPKLPNGRYVYTDELLTLIGKIGNRHLQGKEPNDTVLFDNASSCFKQYEDWIAEYTEADLPNEIRKKQPDLMGIYEKINENLRSVREALRPIYGKLPKSVFHGEERGGSLLMDESGHLIGFCDFTDGGSDVCINHFLCLAMQMDETLPEDYAWLAVHDSEIDRQRVQSVIHALQVIGQEYVWTDEELTALPLVYKLMLFGRPYYYGVLFGLMNDGGKLKEMLEVILDKLASPDEIDFREVLLSGK